MGTHGFGIWIAAFASILILVSQLSAAASTGTEVISIYPGSLSVPQNGKGVASYNLSLTNGYYNYGTSVSVSNIALLASNNIVVILSNKFGNPGMNGTMTIFPSPNATPGIYNVTLGGSSAGIIISPVMLTLTVGPSGKSGSTSTVYQVTSYSIASTSINNTGGRTYTTIGQTQQGGQTNYMQYAVVLVLILVVVGSYYLFYKKKR